LGTDLTLHLNRVIGFNTRKQNPTAWELDIHTGPDSLERMLKERPGNVVVISGRNKGKIDRIKACVDAGLNVLVDKPWVIVPEDLPKLEAALNGADQKGVIAYDIMTERWEITSILQREMIQNAEVFGTMVPGTAEDPGVYMESVHYLMKLVAGLPLLRPAWFFDVNQQGEALSDVGTHLVDLVQWNLYPEQLIDTQKDIQMVAAKRWPTVMTLGDFQKVTGEKAFPDYLDPVIKDGKLNYFCNTQVTYALKGVHTKLDVLWKYEAAPGTGDTHLAVFRGTKSRVEVRQGKNEKFRPEVYIVPNEAGKKAEVLAAVQKKVEALLAEYPGLTVEDLGKEVRIQIPDKYRVGHEAHFAQVTNRYFGFLKNPKTLPAWEKAFMLAKYYVSTKGVELSKQGIEK
jgi:predicted dehydrogenase